MSTSPPTSARRRPTSEAVLRDRARGLARPVVQPGVTAETGDEHVVFLLHQTRYAVPANAVTSVTTLRDLLPLPGVPASIRGLIHLRGRILPVFDLGALWQIAGTGPTAELVLQLDRNGVECGLVAHEVVGVNALDPSKLVSLAARGAFQARHLRGVIDEVVVIDLPALLADLAADSEQMPSSSPL